MESCLNSPGDTAQNQLGPVPRNPKNPKWILGKTCSGSPEVSSSPSSSSSSSNNNNNNSLIFLLLPRNTGSLSFREGFLGYLCWASWNDRSVSETNISEQDARILYGKNEDQREEVQNAEAGMKVIILI